MGTLGSGAVILWHEGSGALLGFAHDAVFLLFLLE
jgi:hypothetical protein